MTDDLGSVLWETMKRSGAVWEYPYQKGFLAPHPVLRSGKHSDGFVDTLQYLSVVSNLTQAARSLAKKLKEKLGDIEIDWVIGSPMAGITFATVVAPMLGARRIAFTEKVGGDNKKLTCRFSIPFGESFLVIEEMTTTGATLQRGIEAVLQNNSGATPLDFVGAFLTRCSDFPPELKSRELVPVISLSKLGVHYGEWKTGNCPLCKQGSKPIENCKRIWPALLRTMKDPTYPIEPTC